MLLSRGPAAMRGLVATRSPVLASLSLARAASLRQPGTISLARSFTSSRTLLFNPSFFRANVPPPPASTTPPPPSPPPYRPHKWTYARYGFPGPKFSAKHPWLAMIIRFSASVVLGVSFILGVVLCHDAFTYSKKHIERVPCSPLALHPRRGGPKNLPIIELNLDDEEDPAKVAMASKPRLVILGGGWGSVAILKKLPPSEYNVTVIAPDNYFCFTPLLPSACVGTVEVRSLVEPLRRLVARVRGHFVTGAAVDIEMAERLVEVEIPGPDGESRDRAYIPYDKLIIAVGSRSNDHGVKGLQYCYQLKTIPDAQKLRRAIMTNLEKASLPTTTPEERKLLLSFVVCGGGPTGVEFAAELSDMFHEDVLNYYPKILKDDIKVTIIQSRDHILNTYSEKISEYAEKHFAREDIDVITNARVTEVGPNSVSITVKDSEGHLVPREIPASVILWSTGIAMQPFTQRMVELLPNQYHSKAVQVDAHLRVEGAPKGTVYAIGDAATVHLNMLGDLLTMWDRFDENKDNKIDAEEWKKMAKFIKKKYPLASGYLQKIHDVFAEFDADEDKHLSLNEAAELFMHVSKKVTALPATAQVAAQQGEYIGAMLKELAKDTPTLKDNGIDDLDDEVYFRPFKYRNLGSLAYIGNSAAFDLNGFSSAGGLLAMYAWRSVYWSEQVSMRTRFMLMLDWVKRGIFGRDLSKF